MVQPSGAVDVPWGQDMAAIIPWELITEELLGPLGTHVTPLTEHNTERRRKAKVGSQGVGSPAGGQGGLLGTRRGR